MIALFCSVAAQRFCVEFVCAWILYSSFLPQSKDKNNRLTRTSNMSASGCLPLDGPVINWRRTRGVTLPSSPDSWDGLQLPYDPDYRRSGDRNLADG